LVSDVKYFSTRFNLPAPVIEIVNQTGGSVLPQADTIWAREVILDVTWAHAIAPAAKILVVCAKTAGLDDMYVATWYAAQKAKYVSLSWGSVEFDSQREFDAEFKKYTDRGVSFFSATGDQGSVRYPASSPYVIGVGGTSIKVDTNRKFLSESVYAYSGGGCSAYSLPCNGQKAILGTLCSGKRATPDISSLADPNTGVLIYHTYGCINVDQTTCFRVLGGTSLSSPIVAAYAASTGRQFTHQALYSKVYPIRDISSGSSSNMKGVYNNATIGYDLATGVGSILGKFPITTAAPSTTKAPSTPTPAPTHGKCVILETGGSFKW
jgi:subtilase family serine protease